MRVFIITDLEGASGVDHADMIEPVTEGYRKACEYLMADTNAAVEGAFAGGADEVFVVDGHGGGGNFIDGALHPRAQMPGNEKVFYGTWEGYDALVCVGAHAMAGTTRAFLDHTQCAKSIFDYKVDGKCYGEMGQQAITAGFFGFPLVAVCGDEAACREAKGLVPEVACAVVKRAEQRNVAECVEQKEALARIFAAVKDGVERYRQIKPYQISLPAEISVTYYRNDMCDEVMREGLVREGRTLKKTIDTIHCYVDVAIL